MKLLGLTLLLLSVVCVGNAFNITKILNGFPEYSTFTSYLTRTKLADEINSRQTITVLAVKNGAMGDLTGLPLPTIKRALSLHVVLDYFDPAKLHEITNGTTLTTTLYQTTGNAPGNTGFVNITDLKGGKVGFGTSLKGTKLDSTYVKSIKQVGYNLSVIEVSQPITTDVAAAPAPAPTETNITAVLLKGGCKIFAGLLVSTGAIKTYEDNLVGGLTVFAPADSAFKSVMPKFNKFIADDKVSLLEFHASPTYSPMGTLKTTNGHLTTLATGGGSKYALDVATSGESVVLSTGIDKATVASTLVDDQPLAVFIVDKVLKPKELFTAAPAPAPAPEAETPATAPDVSSPPAPAAPADSPSDSDGPSADVKTDASLAPASCVGRGLQLILSVALFGSLFLL